MSSRLTERPHCIGAWVAAPMPVHDTEGAHGGAPTGGEGDDEDEAGVDERQLAKDDPAAGLLHMQVSLRPGHWILNPRRNPEEGKELPFEDSQHYCCTFRCQDYWPNSGPNATVVH